MNGIDLKEFSWLIAIALFFGAAVTDAVWAQFTFQLTKRRSFTAASLSFVIALLAAVEIIVYVNNLWYVFPLALGAFVGTFVVIEWEKRKHSKKQRR